MRRTWAEIKQPGPDPDSGEQLDIVDKPEAAMAGRSPSEKRRDRQEQLMTSWAWTTSRKCGPGLGEDSLSTLVMKKLDSSLQVNKSAGPVETIEPAAGLHPLPR